LCVDLINHNVLIFPANSSKSTALDFALNSEEQAVVIEATRAFKDLKGVETLLSGFSNQNSFASF